MECAVAPRPLDGFRVLDFTQNVAGPLAGQVLADLGAEVIKIEAPGGESARRIVSVIPGRKPLAAYFLPNNRGKKSVMVDLREPGELARIIDLADSADVVIEAFRPGVMERLGLGPEDLQRRNPKLVYGRLSAYGANGPNGDRPGIDLIVAAEAGMTTGLRSQVGGPQIIPFQLVDGATGHVFAQAILAALLNRERHGVADVVKIAMYDVAVSLQANQLMLHLNKPTTEQASKADALPADRGAKPKRHTVAFAAQPSEAFKAKDGYVVLSAYLPKHWIKLTEVLGRPDLAVDKRFASQTERAINYHELREALEAALSVQTVSEWVDAIQAVGLMAVPAHSWKQVVATELFVENELGVTLGEGDDAVTMVRTPARYKSFQPAGVTLPPEAGQHNDELLGAKTALPEPKSSSLC